MKNVITFALFSTLLSVSAWALPSLQLDVSDGIYVGGSDETTYSTGPVFDLIALGQAPAGTYYIAASIGTSSASENFGSFSINGTSYTNADVVFGNPGLAPHGVYDASYVQIAFTFNPLALVAAYNVQDGLLSPGFLQYVNFAVDVTGLKAGYAVHFDLYGGTKGRNGKWSEFAPFSHDAQSGGRVPDAGATVCLLGLGLIGLAALGRKTNSR